MLHAHLCHMGGQVSLGFPTCSLCFLNPFYTGTPAGGTLILRLGGSSAWADELKSEASKQ